LAELLCVYRQVKILKAAHGIEEEIGRGGDHLAR
jgi:hypothetical protein